MKQRLCHGDPTSSTAGHICSVWLHKLKIMSWKKEILFSSQNLYMWTLHRHVSLIFVTLLYPYCSPCLSLHCLCLSVSLFFSFSTNKNLFPFVRDCLQCYRELGGDTPRTLLRLLAMSLWNLQPLQFKVKALFSNCFSHLCIVFMVFIAVSCLFRFLVCKIKQ